jgi:hypothetical protein
MHKKHRRDRQETTEFSHASLPYPQNTLGVWMDGKDGTGVVIIEYKCMVLVHRLTSNRSDVICT